MKLFWKIFKYTAFSTLGILLLGTAGLFIYYEMLYVKSPELLDIKSFKIIPQSKLSDKPVLLPLPKRIKWTSESYKMLESPGFIDEAPPEDKQDIMLLLDKFITNNKLEGFGLKVNFIKNTVLQPQEYLLSIKNSGIIVQYHYLQGVFYALTTLKQVLLQSTNRILPGVEITDHPDLKVRGALMDISRNKIPKLKTLYGLVDFLADLKYNHLQLYIEGFAFAYPSFKNLWQDTDTPLSPEEIQQLDKYCKDRFIELVPNQNSLGHMTPWLETDEYKDLAECPDGYKLMGLIDMKGTLDPTDPRSLELIQKMSEDLLPNFTSDQFNVNLDEPFELGECKSKAAATKVGGKAMLYLDYTQKLHKYVKDKGKKMMMWGDVVTKHPEILDQMPKEITLLEWGYEFNHPFEENCYRLQQAKQPFMVCPGTSSWSSFTGRTFNMMGNIENAVENGIRFGAEGMLNTDWGDFGHLQYLTVSYAGLAYGGALSWNYQAKEQIDLSAYLSKMVFQDEANLMGNLVLNMGTYNQFEEIPMVAGTTTGFALRFAFMDKVMIQAINQKVQPGILALLGLPDDIEKFYRNSFKNPQPYNHQAILYLVDSLENQLEKVKIKRTDAQLITDEYKNALNMIRLCAKIKQYNNYQLQQSQEENLALLREMKTLCPKIIEEHKRLWLARNKPGRLDLSLTALVNFQNQLNTQIKKEEKSGIGRWMNRFMQKVFSAGTSLFL